MSNAHTETKFISDDDNKRVHDIMMEIGPEIDKCDNPLNATFAVARCLVQAALANVGTKQKRDNIRRVVQKYVFSD